MVNKIQTRAQPSHSASNHGPARQTERLRQAEPVDKAERSRGDWAEALPRATTTRLKPFIAYYSEADPKALERAEGFPKGGETVDTFTAAQIRALHHAYWHAPPNASIAEMIAFARRDPAFKGRKEPVDDRQAGRLFAKLPEAFPWGWRSRTLAATSYLFIEALLTSPEGTPVGEILARLEKAHPGFPSYSAFRKAGVESWPTEPARFPFAKLLHKEGDAFPVVAQGPVQGHARDRLGRLVVDRKLAEHVAALCDDPRVRYDWELEQFIGLVQKEIGPEFTQKSFAYLRESYGKLVPTFHETRLRAMGRIAQLIRQLYDDGVARDTATMVKVLHEQHGYPLYPTTVFSYFREHYPIVPSFKADKAEAAYDEARTFLEAVKRAKGQDLVEVGRALGHSVRRTGNLVTLIRKRWPDELPKLEQHNRYTADDVAVVKQVIADAPLDATLEDLRRTLESQHPTFFARHVLASGTALRDVLGKHAGIDSWTEHRLQRFSEAFASIAKRSPAGTPFGDIVNVLIDEVPGAPSPAAALDQARRWKAHPEEFPAIAALRDRQGVLPWDKASIRLTRELADEVGAFMKKHPELSVPQIVARLHRDRAFAAKYPSFNSHHLHRLRAAFGEETVPFVSELAVRGREARRAAQQRLIEKELERVAKAADDFEDTRGLTVAALARKLRLPPHRVLTAIHTAPERFPWYRARPAGNLDEYLATRVAHAIDQAPLGTLLGSIVDELRADPEIARRYPAFNYHSIAALRERYPDLVPDFIQRDRILRSKLITTALLSAEKGTSFKQVLAKLETEYPGVFASRYDSPKSLAAMWEAAPQRYPFVDALRDRRGKLLFEGHGAPAEHEGAEAVALANRLARLQNIPERLPLLERIAEEAHHKSAFAEFEIVAVQHLLDSQVPTFDTYRKLGMTPARTTVVGVPYSASQAVVDTLTDKGWDVRVPPLDMESWVEDVKGALRERLAAAKASGHKIICLDDGGICSQLIATEFKDDAPWFRIVEQTRRGITVAEGLELRTSVVNVAQSWGKYVEGPIIAGEIDRVLLRRLERLGLSPKDLAGKHIGVVGGGTIGLPIARAMERLGAHVTILDKEPAKVGKGAPGMKVVDADDTVAREHFFSSQELIIGATGVRSITADDMKHLKRGAIIGSASSKLVEIDVEGLAELAKGKNGKVRMEVIDAESHPPTVRYHLTGGRTIDLLARGFPLNFDGGPENSPPERIQLTRALMLIGALQATSAKVASITRLDLELQTKVLRHFRSLEAADMDEEQREALSLAELRLVEAKKKRGLDDRRQ